MSDLAQCERCLKEFARQSMTHTGDDWVCEGCYQEALAQSDVEDAEQAIKEGGTITLDQLKTELASPPPPASGEVSKRLEERADKHYVAQQQMVCTPMNYEVRDAVLDREAAALISSLETENARLRRVQPVQVTEEMVEAALRAAAAVDPYKGDREKIRAALQAALTVKETEG